MKRDIANMTPEQRRRLNREYQAKARATGRSYTKEIEDLKIILALEAGEISEGHAVKAINHDRLCVRKMRNQAVEEGKALAFVLHHPLRNMDTSGLSISALARIQEILNEESHAANEKGE